MARTPQRRPAKPSTGRLARSQRNRRNETFRSVNRIGKQLIAGFLAMPFLGYLLIKQEPVHVTIPANSIAAAVLLMSTVVGAHQARRRRR